MKELKMKLLLVCALVLLVGAPVALGDWYPGDGHKMHFPQMPDPNGWDVAFWNDVMFVIPLELADDWRCSETGPVEDIHFWVSWKGGVPAWGYRAGDNEHLLERPVRDVWLVRTK